MASILNATTSTGFTVTPDNSGSLQLATNNGTTAVTINTSQQIGIGTTSPAAPLDVVSDSGSSAISVRGRSSDNLSAIRIYSNNGATQYGVIRGASDELRVNATEAIPLTFYTNNSERMRISSGGLVSMGTSGVANSQRLTLYAATNQWGVGGTTSSDTFSILNNGGAGVALSWGSTSWSGVSDEKLKNITGEINNGISKVCSLRAAEFTWKSDEENKPQVGLIAQDVQKVLPEAVSEENDVLAIRYTEVIPLLVASIKELNTDLANTKLLLTEVSNKVEAQAVRIAELEGAK
jgi:hypothetical protein